MEEEEDEEEKFPAVVALDCEMAYTEADPMDLVRVSVVGLTEAELSSMASSTPVSAASQYNGGGRVLLERIKAKVLDWRARERRGRGGGGGQGRAPRGGLRRRARLGPRTIVVGHSLHSDLRRSASSPRTATAAAAAAAAAVAVAAAAAAVAVAAPACGHGLLFRPGDARSGSTRRRS